MIEINNKLDITSTRIELKTEDVIKKIEIVDFLNQNSYRIINVLGSYITAWGFDNDLGLGVFTELIEKI